MIDLQASIENGFTPATRSHKERAHSFAEEHGFEVEYRRNTQETGTYEIIDDATVVVMNPDDGHILFRATDTNEGYAGLRALVWMEDHADRWHKWKCFIMGPAGSMRSLHLELAHTAITLGVVKGGLDRNAVVLQSIFYPNIRWRVPPSTQAALRRRFDIHVRAL